MGDKKGRQDGRKADAPSNTGTHVGRQWETMVGKTSGGTTHHPTTGTGVWGDNGTMGLMGDKGGQDLGKADTPTQADKTRPHPTQAHMRGDNGRQWGAMGDKTSGRRTHHPTQAHMWGDNGKHWETREIQDIEKVNTSSNTGTHVGRQRETSETRSRERGHTNQQKGNTKGDIEWETKGDKTKANTLRMR